MNMPYYVKGTCTNCKSRFRFDADTVLKLSEIHCEACRCVLDPEPIKRAARQVLEKANRGDSSVRPISVFQTCAYCKNLFPLRRETLGTLESVICPSCLAKRGLNGSK